MENYEKIPFDQISNIESYVEEKLRAGHIIIQISVNDDKKAISQLVSYANDKECMSCFRDFAGIGEEELPKSVIEEEIEPYYAFKDDEKVQDVHTADIDIETDRQYITSFRRFKATIKEMEEYFNGACFNEDDEMMHYEFYISTGKGDIANFGGNMELDFITEWMTEHGYYGK